MKMFNNSTTRIFLQGNEDVARWHLPVVLSKFKAFVSRCKNSGIKQDRFTMVFDEDGTIVYGQYFYGEESIQVYSPVYKVVIKEKSQNDLSVEIVPKTFWINTTKGYFWVEVRYIDGVPTVMLTMFEAMSGDEFVYPGMQLTTPGMIAGCFDDTATTRYVLSQNGGILTGVTKEKGTISSTAIIDGSARISVIENSVDEHDYVLMVSDCGRDVEVRRIKILNSDGALSITRQYASIGMALEGETSIFPSNILPNPTWVHRKCTGSYFSPNKTIGYHVDIGTDDDFWGNITELGGGLADKLDNTGGADEALFNHSPDLYRILSLIAAPVSIDEASVSFVVCCPTMVFYNGIDELDKKCWGGYGITQDWASCVDYGPDYETWMLSPRPMICKYVFSSGEKTYSDFLLSPGSANWETEIRSWCNNFVAKAYVEQDYSCDTLYHNIMETAEVSSCTWSEAITGNCDPPIDTVGYSGFAAKEWNVIEHWSYYTRENIKNSKKISFMFNAESPNYNSPGKMFGFYFMFDGLWHLDIGVHWATSETKGNSCGLISYPYTEQNPGDLVYFKVCGGGDTDWIINNGHEYVDGLDIVTPLGIHSMPGLYGSADHLGFIAKVPESLAAPADPKVLTGGVSYPAAFGIEGETVSCERKILSRPCICENTTMGWGTWPDMDLYVFGTYLVFFSGGCPPFQWVSHGAVLVDVEGIEIPEIELEQLRTAYAAVDGCDVKIDVIDACMQKISVEATYSIDGVATGDDVIKPGESAVYYHNLGAGASYTGDVPGVTFEGESGNGAVVSMPESATPGGSYTVSFSGKCGSTAVKEITAGYPCVYNLDLINAVDPGTYPQIGQWIYNGECYQKVTRYYKTANIECTIGETCPDGDYYLSPCDWDLQFEGAVKIYKLGEVVGNVQYLTHYVWAITERTWGNPCL